MEIDPKLKTDWQRKRWQYSLNAIIFSVALLFSFIFLFVYLERGGWRYDFTANQEFTLSPQTLEVLKNLDQDIVIRAFFSRGETLDDVYIKRKVGDVFGEYTSRSKKIDFQMIDPNVDIEAVTQYQITADGTIIFQSKNNKKQVTKSQLFDFSEMNDKATPAFIGEGVFTNTILAVTTQTQKQVCFLEGHGERSLTESQPTGFLETKNYLEKNNYKTATVSFIKNQDLKGCSLLIIAGPKQVIPEAEQQRILDWQDQGGHLLILAEPMTGNPFPRILSDLKITLNDDVVMDPERHFVLGDHYPAPILEKHPITKGLEDINPILFGARSLEHPVQDPYVDILTTSSSAWGETDALGKKPQFDQGSDKKGPLSLATLIQRPKKNPAETQPSQDEFEPVSIVVGDADFAANGLVQAPGNLDLFLNMVGYLVGNKDQVSIRPKTPEFRNLSLTAGKVKFMAYFSQFVYPSLFLALGGWYWWRRRKL